MATIPNTCPALSALRRMDAGPLPADGSFDRYSTPRADHCYRGEPAAPSSGASAPAWAYCAVQGHRARMRRDRCSSVPSPSAHLPTKGSARYHRHADRVLNLLYRFCGRMGDNLSKRAMPASASTFSGWIVQAFGRLKNQPANLLAASPQRRGTRTRSRIASWLASAAHTAVGLAKVASAIRESFAAGRAAFNQLPKMWESDYHQIGSNPRCADCGSVLLLSSS